MKNFLSIGLIFTSLVFIGCRKTGIPVYDMDPYEWMDTHPQGQVAYTDYFSGNYIVNTSQGYSVVEGWGGYTPRDFDILYAHFQFTGLQTIYNRSGNYFTQGRIVGSWLSWSEANYLLDQISR